MKTLIAILFLSSASFAFGQDSYDPFRTSGDPHGTYKAVLQEFEQQGTADEIYAIMHESDYGYLLSDSILLLRGDLSDCLEALRAGDASPTGTYECPVILGTRVDRLIGRHGSIGEVDTRSMITQAIVLEKQRISECISKWNSLLAIYRGSNKPVAVVAQ